MSEEKKPSKKRHPYEGLAVKSQRGEYKLIDPLDYIILSLLPNEGEMFAGLYPLGETVIALVSKLRSDVPKEAQKIVKSSMISSRIRVLNMQNLIVGKQTAVATSQGQVWQRTEKGREVLKQWEAKQKEVKGGTRG